MKWYSYLICAICIVLGIFSTVAMVRIWSESSGVYGTFSYESIETKNNYDEVAKFDYGAIKFSTNDYENYSNTETFTPVKFDGTKKDYVLLVNDNICSDVQIYAGKIVATATIKFYNTDGDNCSTANLNFLIEFTEDKVTVTTSTKNENSSIAYLDKYMNVHGFVLKIVERGA